MKKIIRRVSRDMCDVSIGVNTITSHDNGSEMSVAVSRLNDAHLP